MTLAQHSFGSPLFRRVHVCAEARLLAAAGRPGRRSEALDRLGGNVWVACMDTALPELRSVLDGGPIQQLHILGDVAAGCVAKGLRIWQVATGRVGLEASTAVPLMDVAPIYRMDPLDPNAAPV